MARYIDAELAIELKDKEMNHVYDLTDLEEYLAGVPTADVAPKSELAREIFARVRKAFYDVSSEMHNELTKAILNDDKYTIDLLSGEDYILRAVRCIIEEFAKEYTEADNE